LPDAVLRQIASVCASFEVDGLRADIVIARTALAHAAWEGRKVADSDDVRVAARLALPHRRRRNPFDAPGLDEEQLDDALTEGAPDDDDPGAAARLLLPLLLPQKAKAHRRPSVRCPRRASPLLRRPTLSVLGGSKFLGLAAAPPVAGRGPKRTPVGHRLESTHGKAGRLHLVSTMLAAAPQQKARGRTVPVWSCGAKICGWRGVRAASRT